MLTVVIDGRQESYVFDFRFDHVVTATVHVPFVPILRRCRGFLFLIFRWFNLFASVAVFLVVFLPRPENSRRYRRGRRALLRTASSKLYIDVFDPPDAHAPAGRSATPAARACNPLRRKGRVCIEAAEGEDDDRHRVCPRVSSSPSSRHRVGCGAFSLD